MDKSLLLTCCGKSPSPVAIRLVDVFEPAYVEGKVTAEKPPWPRTESRFDGSAPSPSGETVSATQGWQAGPGVADLQVWDGRLVGRSTSDCPIIYAERTVGLDDSDTLHAIEIRMRVSAGSNLSLRFSNDEKLDLEWMVDHVIKIGLVPVFMPMVADSEMKTYTISQSHLSYGSSGIRHVLIRPTDVEGATFEIEFVRLIFRKEYLGSIPAGISWQGLSEIFHQTLVAKTPGVIRFPLTLPDRPWLDLAIGTIEDGPVTFQVKIWPGDGSAEDVALLRRTITTPHRWETVQIDLSDYATESVILSLSLAAERGGPWASGAHR